MTLGKRLTTLIVQVSHEAELLKLVELYSGDVHKMGGHLVVTLGRESKWSLLWPHGTEPFELVQLSLVDGHELAGHLAVTLERLCTITVDSYNSLQIYIFVYHLTKHLYLGAAL